MKADETDARIGRIVSNALAEIVGAVEDNLHQECLGKANLAPGKYHVIHAHSYYAPVTEGELGDEKSDNSMWPRKLEYMINNGYCHIGAIHDKDIAYKIVELLNA